MMVIYVELQEKLGRYEVWNFKNWLYIFVCNYCLMQLWCEKKDMMINFDLVFM